MSCLAPGTFGLPLGAGRSAAASVGSQQPGWEPNENCCCFQSQRMRTLVGIEMEVRERTWVYIFVDDNGVGSLWGWACGAWRRMLLKVPLAPFWISHGALQEGDVSGSRWSSRGPYLQRWRTWQCSPLCRLSRRVVWQLLDVWHLFLAARMAPCTGAEGGFVVVRKGWALRWMETTWGFRSLPRCPKILCLSWSRVYVQWGAVSRCWGRYPACKLVLSGSRGWRLEPVMRQRCWWRWMWSQTHFPPLKTDGWGV